MSFMLRQAQHERNINRLHRSPWAVSLSFDFAQDIRKQPFTLSLSKGDADFLRNQHIWLNPYFQNLPHSYHLSDSILLKFFSKNTDKDSKTIKEFGVGISKGGVISFFSEHRNHYSELSF